MLMILTENETMRPTPDVAALVDFAVVAEEAGFDSVMVSEHVVLGSSSGELGLPDNPRDYALPGNQASDTQWPSPLVLLSAVAQATSRIRLVAGAMITPLRHPLTIAKDLATLDRLCAGRLVLLPTVSWHEDEYRALGVPFSQRGAILDEQLEVLDAAWSGSPATHSGPRFPFEAVWVEPQPFRSGGPPLWFGGSKVHPALLRRLVRYGRGFNPLGRPTEADMTLLAQALHDAGRDIHEIEMVGGTRGRFPDADSVADLDEALATIPEQMAAGFTTICIKPSQFIDRVADLPAFSKRVIDVVATF
jgi:probable F420-dependent oxidoreductase